MVQEGHKTSSRFYTNIKSLCAAVCVRVLCVFECVCVCLSVCVCIFFSAFLSTVLNLFPLAMRVCGSLGPFVYTKPAEDRQRERRGEGKGERGQEIAIVGERVRERER